jgi:hypothetical protein
MNATCGDNVPCRFSFHRRLLFLNGKILAKTTVRNP